VRQGTHDVVIELIEIQALDRHDLAPGDEDSAVHDGVRAVPHLLQQIVVAGLHRERRRRRGALDARAPPHGGPPRRVPGRSTQHATPPRPPPDTRPLTSVSCSRVRTANRERGTRARQERRRRGYRKNEVVKGQKLNNFGGDVAGARGGRDRAAEMWGRCCRWVWDNDVWDPSGSESGSR
jgi:hypothetical protein